MSQNKSVPLWFQVGIALVWAVPIITGYLRLVRAHPMADARAKVIEWVKGKPTVQPKPTPELAYGSDTWYLWIDGDGQHRVGYNRVNPSNWIATNQNVYPSAVATCMSTVTDSPCMTNATSWATLSTK